MHLVFQVDALGAQLLQLRLVVGKRRLALAGRQQPLVAREGVEGEVSDQHRQDDGRDEGEQPVEHGRTIGESCLMHG